MLLQFLVQGTPYGPKYEVVDSVIFPKLGRGCIR